MADEAAATFFEVECGSLIYNKYVSLTETEGGFLIPSGGYVLTGYHHRLALILYASGSIYDRHVQSDLAHGRTVVFELGPRIEISRILPLILLPQIPRSTSWVQYYRELRMPLLPLPCQ
ncbi:MAG: hypothetical protein ALECFALPRED_009759 [Alectoria fallacina]|uniref:Uncharacterized protein n=1 Tax=Alectoria fallacina TaxID=1903189 RepID=A0A8H3J8M0_9LECA|nr:MAG: hypothetical protein ALECFALPRED_009759 [Alectoria fallacina]